MSELLDPPRVGEPAPPATAPAAAPDDAAASEREPAYGARVVALALVVVAAIFVPALVLVDQPQDVLTVTAPAFTVISGLVAGYLGTRAGTLVAARDRTAGVR